MIFVFFSGSLRYKRNSLSLWDTHIIKLSSKWNIFHTFNFHNESIPMCRKTHVLYWWIYFLFIKNVIFYLGGRGEARCFSTIWISFMYMQKQKECFYFSSDFLFSFSPRTVHVNFALIYFEIFFLLLTFIMKDVIWEKIYINEYIFFRNFFVLSNTIISLEEKLHFFSVLKIWSFL